MQDFHEIHVAFTTGKECNQKDIMRFYKHCSWEIKIQLRKSGYRLNAENDADVDEILGYLSVQVFKSADQFDPERGTFKNWANSIIRRLVIDFIRRIEADKRPPITDIDDETIAYLFEDIRVTHRPEMDYIEKETVKELYEFINDHLNSYQYHVLYYTVEGYQPSDIAKILSKTPEQISKTLYRTRKKISTILGERKDKH